MIIHTLDAYMKMMHVQAQGTEQRETEDRFSVVWQGESVVAGDGPGLKPQLQLLLLQTVIVKVHRNRTHQRCQFHVQASSHFHLVQNNSDIETLVWLQVFGSSHQWLPTLSSTPGRSISRAYHQLSLPCELSVCWSSGCIIQPEVSTIAALLNLKGFVCKNSFLAHMKSKEHPMTSAQLSSCHLSLLCIRLGRIGAGQCTRNYHSTGPWRNPDPPIIPQNLSWNQLVELLSSMYTFLHTNL